jgi:hypothetical protein
MLTRSKPRIASLWVLLAIGAISLPLLASITSAVAATRRATPPIGKQLAELRGYDTVTGDYFGGAVAISGTTAIVGADSHAKDAGRAYVFTKTAKGWKQAAELKGSDTVADDDFGYSVAISGTTAIVRAYNYASGVGRAYVFTNSGAVWKQAAELKGSDAVAGDYFGSSVAVSGTTAIVGAYGHAKDAGRAYVFTKTATGWKQTAELKGSDTVASDYFGYSVAISGASAVVGAPYHGNDAGRTYVFTKTALGWKQVAELKVAYVGHYTYGGFGWSVAISGTTAVVGAPGDANILGRAFVFSKTAGVWKQTAKLKVAYAHYAFAGFGWSVAISGTTAVVGASGNANFLGRAFVFSKTSTGWKQAAELLGSDTVVGDGLGWSVAISGMTAIVGAYGHAKDGGRAYGFEA